MQERSYTLIIVPECSSRVRRVTITQRALARVAFAGVAVVALAAFMSVHYAFVVDQAAANGELKDENVTLKARLRVVQDEIARIDATLQRVEQFNTRVRAITQLNDPERNLAMGPLAAQIDEAPRVLYEKGERIDFEDELIESQVALRFIESSLDSARDGALGLEEQVRDLYDYFDEHEGLLATTPSIRPTHSKLLTSGFGLRTDPYTDQRVMHKGIDLAAANGADVIAPADGLVIYAGNRGQGYGKTVVLDHGFGVQTHYAHLSVFKVQLGEKVTRGQVIAGVGNTGRSTGAHLHYEVRFNGIPQDPEKFMLD